MGPVMGVRSSHYRPTVYTNLPFDGLVYVRLQIILLHSQKHESNDARERIRSLFDKFSTPLAWLVHSCRTEISVMHAG
jgi:hypothetical protein